MTQTLNAIISIHVPREGHDSDICHSMGGHGDISIHVPREGHDGLKRRPGRCTTRYFNPRAPRGARLPRGRSRPYRRNISIHVPREGHDHIPKQRELLYVISIHVPREGHD